MSSNPNFVLQGSALESRASYQSGSPENQWVEVLVDCPEAEAQKKLYTYRLPSELQVQPGDILSVPFGAQVLGAIAIRIKDAPPPELNSAKIKDVEDVVSAGFFPPSYWQLLNRVAEYYYTQLIQVIRVALPPGLLGRSQRRIRLIKGDKRDSPIPNPQSPIPNPQYLSPAARQILEILQAQSAGDYSFAYLQRQVRGAYRAVRELLRNNLVESYLEPPRKGRPKLQKAVTLVVDVFPIDVTQRQREILEVLRRRGGDLWLTELLQICNASSSTVKTLEQKGCVVIQEREMLRSAAEPALAEDQPKELTNDQAQALEVITNLSGFSEVLLHGVTGSGKTEVYLQAIAPILESGQSALVLVPEIGLTPQLTDRFRARFGNKVCVYHSALSDGERYDTWRQMLAGAAQVVIGTRSAIFAPLPRLGLIILDEEHDSSFKQDQPAPTYHARTVATWRAELENCPLLLGSATPSLETWVNINQGFSRESGIEGIPNPQSPIPNPQPPITHYLSLPERIQSRPLPPVEVVDMRSELQQGNRSIFSRSLTEGLQQLQERGQQGILFIHRRGHSTFVSCRSCGYVVECPHCDVSLAYHHTHEDAAQLLRCHYCNFVRSHPQSCPECGSPYLKFFGSGTQRVAQELAQAFPQLRFIRFDSDTTRTKGAHRTLLTRFANGEADLLVGTQMLTKGLDLAQVTLVGVVAADGLLNLPDYRASERAFQTLTQVAGRAGRGNDPGRVIIQTYTPEHQVIQAVRRHEYQSFIETELQQREALNYPPYGRLILLRLSSTDPAQVQETAELLAATLTQKDEDSAGYEILGPAPATILRVANRYRWQIMLKFAPDSLPHLPDFTELRFLCPSSVSLTIDVDPLNLM
ncbi:primosomal protein N' [Funiculus sociatus GB2-A5]|uniref:Replication restart protein PriA n=1 Tax=Funiculus sociatus GB2-A5 TaxID=2933946 RepID=A0ABV0JJT1_9CYAN|nr:MULTISPECIES: primosomal protein N' [unclassified Trichocoleus]MBD1907088.1 primosomal protein N' [Trichocoleus sp. FACHB-832]MBD2063509.1 primosomal protein N' [Trichocoleus sp. FACHB-6]